ncbi:MAG TPA: O-acetylhomoserine aminocarboxypropyltransferase [Acidimicrobiia bacterium]|nr:O-acetylhomoserine aminocarboxypropyltransferase [Acidimicrobiia bacterium]
MVEPDLPGFETMAVHAGVEPDPRTGARTIPIYLSAGFQFEDTAHAASLFNLERPGHIYSRISNPTVAAFEERIAALEGGVGAVATASGQAALVLAITTLMGSGCHIVSSSALYGGTANLFRHTLPRFGIEVTFVTPGDHDGFRAAIRPETRLIFGEIIGNPVMDVLDVANVSSLAHQAGVPLLIDNTLATPYLCRPFEMGADLVLHSATKFISGHGTVIGGVLVDSGAFDWVGSGRFSTLTEPYAPYSGVVFVDEFGPGAFIARARAEGLRDFGACMGPETAFVLIQGLESLAARMDRHVANAVALAGYLESAPAVAWVRYPSLPDHPDYDLARTMFPKGAGGVMAFAVKGGRDAGRGLIESTRLISHLANLGDARTLIIHPASTTHQQLDASALAAAGIDEGLIRLSAGLEDPTDLIADLARALRASQGK